MTKSKTLLWVSFSAILIFAVLLFFVIEQLNVPPRLLAPYVERRTADHNPFIAGVGAWVGKTLMRLDRGDAPRARSGLELSVGTNASVQGELDPKLSINSKLSGSREILVATSEQLIQAISQATPGDVILLSPGVYPFRSNINVSKTGTDTGRITVRAKNPGTVMLKFDTQQGFHVSAPYWSFENLSIRGICKDHTVCEHAFHIVGKATYFASINNTITDFNAHFKINGENGYQPDFGRIERNTLNNSAIRQTDNPVTIIDLVAASHWAIQKNLISDFVKGQGDQISYGAFAKGAGSDNLFQQNIVVCEWLLRGAPGQRVGLSLGGGGTGKAFCRDKHCITEQDRSTIQSNLIASCSDEGIYLNRAASSKILHNTLVDTGGIAVRFGESSAEVVGNLVDGVIRSRDGGVLRARDNLDTTAASLYLGLHPVRDLFNAPEAFDFKWKKSLERRDAADPVPEDLCGQVRPAQPRYGAFEDFANCN